MRRQSNFGYLLTAVTLGVSQLCSAVYAQDYPQSNSYPPQYSQAQQGQNYSAQGDPASSGAFSQQQQYQQAPGAYPQQYGQSVPPGQPNNQYAGQQGYSTQYSGASQMPQTQPYNQGQYTQQGYQQGQQQYQMQGQYPPAQAQGQPQAQYPQSAPGQEPTYYGYANDGQSSASNYQGQGQFGSYANQAPAQANQATNLQDYLNQSDVQGQQNPSSSEHAQKAEGSGKGAALLSAGKALAGVAGTVATGYFLSKAAQKQAQNGGVPIMPNGYGNPYGYGNGYGMPYGGGYGYGTPYGYGMGGGMNPMGSSVMTGLNSLLGR